MLLHYLVKTTVLPDCHN